MKYRITANSGDDPTAVTLDLAKDEAAVLERVAAAIDAASGEYGASLTVQTQASFEAEASDFARRLTGS